MELQQKFLIARRYLIRDQRPETRQAIPRTLLLDDVDETALMLVRLSRLGGLLPDVCIRSFNNDFQIGYDSFGTFMFMLYIETHPRSTVLPSLD